jgi:hypothetical protein
VTNEALLCLGVLPTLVDRLEAIAIGIENVRCIVARIVIEACPGLAVISRASSHGGVVEPIYLGLALGDKADMRSPGVRIALSEPEENATISSKALEVGMSLGAILTVVIDRMPDTERSKSRFVKGNRSIEIFDGDDDVVEQEFTSGIPTFQVQFVLSVGIVNC